MWIDFVWLIPDRVLVSRHTGPIGCADIEALYVENQPPRSPDATGMQHTIIDNSARGNLLPELMNLRRLAPYIPRMKPLPYQGWTLIIEPTPNKVIATGFSMVMQVANSRMHIVGSMDEALAFLAARDSAVAEALPTLPPYVPLPQPVEPPAPV